MWVSYLVIFLTSAPGFAHDPFGIPNRDPVSDFLPLPDTGLDAGFCAKWNPDFAFKGSQCCARVPWRYRRRGIKCSPRRSKRSFCDEMTEEQRQYQKWFGQLGGKELLTHLQKSLQRPVGQSHCEPHTGFLAYGRPVLGTEHNRLKLRRPGRCVNFGTDRMVAMLEWLGREVNKEYPKQTYPKVNLLVGDISAPRGGCLMGHGGRRGHASHTNGRDVDLGFLYAYEDPRRDVPINYSRRFRAKENWWFLKKVFENPYVCVHKVFLDHRHIRRLKRLAKDDPDWEKYRPFITHVRRHRNHYHVRIGEAAGEPGCGISEDESSMVAGAAGAKRVRAAALKKPAQ